LSGGEARRRQEALLEAGALAWVVPLLFGYDATLESRAGAPQPGASAVQELAAADGIARGGAAAAGGGAERAEGAEGAGSGPAFLGLGGDRNVDQARGACGPVAADGLSGGVQDACARHGHGVAARLGCQGRAAVVVRSGRRGVCSGCGPRPWAGSERLATY